MASEKRLIAENDVYALFGRTGKAELHVADIDLLPRVDTMILPCKIGDTVWAVLHYCGKQCIRQCVVSEMAYLEDMTLAIAVKAAGKSRQRVFWGLNAFSTYEECVAAAGGRSDG